MHEHPPTLAGAFAAPDAKRRYVRRLFATIADRYDLITVLLSFGRDRHWKSRLVSLVDPRPGARVLDLACGTGDIAFEAARRGAVVTGVDITPRMIELARRRMQACPGVVFSVGDMCALPVASGSFDAITTGEPLYSLTGTQKTVETLDRRTGPVDLVLYGPRALGEVLQWPGMVGALGGVVLGFAFLRRRSALGIVTALLALGAFALLACAGLAIIARYTMLAAAVLSVFVALALLCWRLLPAGDPHRRRWQALAAVVALMFVAWAPNQWDLDSTVHSDLADQGTIERDLTDLVDAGAFQPLCGKVIVPNHRAVPRLAFGLDVKPTEIVSATEAGQGGVPDRGYFVAPASPFVIHNFILDPNDPTTVSTTVPHGFRPVARNESWRVYRRC